MSIGYTAFKLAFEISPIIFTNGIAASIPGGMLPVVAITEALNFTTGLLDGGDPTDLDSFFAHFVPIPGSTLEVADYGEYPFANQTVAANAAIAMPLDVSLRMICPVKSELGYAEKLATMIALQKAIQAHRNSGGTYTVVTPAGIYTNCLLKRLSDASAGNSAQAQNTYQWDFRRPLLTQEQATQAQNSLMSKITSGVQVPATNGAVSWSGLSPTVGVPPSLASSSVVGSAAGQQGTVAATGFTSML